MSYHAKKSTGDRTAGIVVVVIFHIVFLWGLAMGLDNPIKKKVEEILKADVKEEVKPPEELPPPPPPEVKPPPPDFVPPPQIDFVPDAPAPQNVIQAVQHTEKTVEKPSNQVAARVDPKKGLSKPPYPRNSERLGEEGLTTMNLFIGEDGRVQDAQLVSSSGHDALDTAAMEHAKKSWKLIPCMVGDKPVACWLKVPLRWKIDSK